MIYILTNIDQIGGILQWTQTICYIFKKINIAHRVIKKVVNINVFDDNTDIIINNYNNNDFFDNIELIKNKNIKLHYVVHSTICPNNIFLSKYYKYIDTIVCVAHYIKLHILKIFPMAIVNILDNYILNNKQKHIVNKSSSITNFVFVGRISPEKNIPMLLYALATIDRNKWKLNIYGECFCKKHEDLISKIIELENLQDNVIFNGYVFDKNIIYSECDYLILPSISEGSSYCVLEALSYGIPVIACKGIGDVNIIEDGKNGFLIDIDGLNNSTNELYANDYSDILLNVGYCATVMMHQRFRYKAIVPPNLCNRGNIIFDKNMKSMKNVLELAIKTKINIEPQIFTSKRKYIKQLTNIFSLEHIDKKIYSIKNKYPLISIIIPVFNRKEKIEATIKSIKNQTYPNLEIIVVDDGSTDDYSDLLKKYTFIKYIRSDVNIGCWSARNIGIKNSNGEYISFHDADDISDKNKIMIQYDCLNNMELNFCGTMMYRTHIDNFDNIDLNTLDNIIKHDRDDSTKIHNLQCCKKILGFATILYKKKLFNEIGLYNEMKRGTDGDWLVRYMEKYENIKNKNPEQLHQYMSINRFGKTYIILSSVTYYSTEFDNKNITQQLQYVHM